MRLNVGNTPITELKKDKGIFIKEEYTNPTGSIKDRAAFFMITDAVRKGLLRAGGTLVEASSGNTGIGLAYAGRSFGINIIIVMPDFVSKEKIALIKTLGGDVVLTAGKKGMAGSVYFAREIAKEKNAFLPDQFSNPANVLAHKLGTGPEILRQMSLDIDAFVAGVGTGGTLMGTARALKEFDSSIKIFAVEPEESAVLSGEEPGIHTIEGIGAGFVPKLFDKNIVCEVIKISQKEAWKESLCLCKEESICGGPSTGANVLASRIVKKKYGFSRIVTVAPDGINRYLSEIET